MLSHNQRCSNRSIFAAISDMTHVRSLDRNCVPPADFCSGETCCDMAGTYPSCRHSCRENMCNNRTAETWLKKPGPIDAFKSVASFSERFNCQVCSYIMSSDPSLTYECVNATIPTPQQVSCEAPYMCITKALFSPGTVMCIKILYEPMSELS